MSRIFHVRINLDSVSADLNTLVDDAERGQWLRGFMSGAAGGTNRFIDASPACLGWHHGAAARGNAEQFHEKQSTKGKLSAEARKSNHGSTTVQPRLDHGSTTDEPNLNLTNKPINQETNKRKNKINQESMLPPSLDEVIAECSAKSYQIDPAKFHREQEGAEWRHKDGTPIKRWKSVLAKWESNHLEWNKPEPSARPRWVPDEATRRAIDDYVFNDKEPHGS